MNPDPSGATSPDGRNDISLTNLTIAAGNRSLLRNAEARFADGEVTLIVGPSGVGKSVLLRVVAGLIPPGDDSIRFRGEAKLAGAPIRLGQVGVVFQGYALFDELSPRGNVQFAKDHARGGTQNSSQDLLQELNVPTDVRTAHLSGGQRQRLAIARTIAFDSPAIMYDEPTSGLDPSNARRVAELIRDTQTRHQKTSIVVTHDYRSLVPIADRVYLLDPLEKKLVDVPREQWDQLANRLQPLAKASAALDDSQSGEKPQTHWKYRAGRFFTRTSKIGEALLWGLYSLLPIWRNFRWGGRYLLHFARLVAGPTAWVYLLIAGVIIGFVTTYYMFEFLPFAGYTEPLLIDDLLSVLGFSLYRILVPVLATIMIAARCGAAVAADVGSKQYGNQIDALKSFGVSPRAYLLSPIMISFLFGTPLLTLLAFWAARLTSLVTFTMTHPDHGPDFWYQHFHRGLHQIGTLVYFGSSWLLAKLVCCGLGVGMIAYYQGLAPKLSSNEVSRAVTITILWATLYVLVVHFGFAFWEFRNQMR